MARSQLLKMNFCVVLVAFAFLVHNGESKDFLETDRIIGGINVRIEDLPFQLALLYGGVHCCGASLIHYDVALTAAHCVEKSTTILYSVRAGTSFNIRGVKNEFVSKISKILSHPNYDETTSNYDIAILFLNDKLPLGPTILPIALPQQDEEVAVGTIAFVAGWGYTKEDGEIQNYLKRVYVPVIDRSFCRKLYINKGNVSNRMICAGLPMQGGSDACQGDSGGPLVAEGKLIGIVSWGHGCGRKQYPGVYTKVSMFRNWIKRNANV